MAETAATALARYAVALKDGRTRDGSLDAFRGTPQQPMTAAELRRKFDNTTRSLAPGHAARLLEALMGVDGLPDVRALPLAG
jgi:hypothetical protein